MAAWSLAVVLVGVLAAAGLLARQAYDQGRLDTARQQALAAARQATVDFVSISAATIDRDLQRISDHATGEFKDEFTQDMPQVRAAVVDNKVDSHGTVLRAAVVSASRTTAVVLVAVDATREEHQRAGRPAVALPDPRHVGGSVRALVGFQA